MKKTILMLGPCAGHTGGMATVIENLESSKLSAQCNLYLLNTGKITAKNRNLFQGIFAQIKILFSLMSLIVCKRVEIVHIHTCSGFTFWRDCFHASVSKVFFCKIVWHIHGGRFHGFASHGRPLTKKILKFALASADSVIVLTEHWKRPPVSG